MTESTLAAEGGHKRREPRSSAVAVKHDPTGSSQPRLVAKGQGGVAEQILQLAFATGVKVREDADLIEILEAVEIDSEVPLEALATVAEILSYIYRANAANQTPNTTAHTETK